VREFPPLLAGQPAGIHTVCKPTITKRLFALFPHTSPAVALPNIPL
jgi:hypothetical protein